MSSEISKLLISIGNTFHEKRLSLVTAESCTGGGLAYHISKTEACSPILERGYITYSNKAKEDVLGVKPHTLSLYGAVSEEVASEMAEGCLQNSKAQISIAITGIAGDCEKASEENVGLVWIACAGTNKSLMSIKKEIYGNREEFLEKVIFEGLHFLNDYVKH